MNEKEIKDMIEPIPNWEFTYRYDCSRTCGKSYTQSLLDEKDKKIKDLQKKVEQLEKENKELNNIINELENTIANFIKNHTESYIDWKYDREIYLAECNILQKLCDTYFDKLKALKENNK